MPPVLAALAPAGATGATATPPSLEELFLSQPDTRVPEKALVCGSDGPIRRSASPSPGSAWR